MSSEFVVCLNVLEASCSNSVDTDQTAPVGIFIPESILFASVLELVNSVRKYLQQTTSADVIFFRSNFFGALRVKHRYSYTKYQIKL